MTLQFEQYYPVNTLTLWDTLTKVEHMQRWYFPQLKKFNVKSGFTTSFNVFHDDRTFTHLWKVIAVVPYSYLKIQWCYLEYTGNSTVEFRLKERGLHSHLKMVHRVTDPFPANIPEFTEESGKMGWSYLLKTRLKDYLTQKSSST